MSGHSKWATTKHKKAVVDARRGKLFAKLIKNVEVAARTGGADPAGNPTLYDAMQKAKKNSVQQKMKASSPAAAMPGPASGTAMRVNVRHQECPAMR
jgi:transcriptional/translational regulatory protein YebC/TACO1